MAVAKSAGIAGTGTMMSLKVLMMTWIRTAMPCTKTMIGMMMRSAASPTIMRIAEHVGLSWEK
jgi:hypothetical protein